MKSFLLILFITLASPLHSSAQYFQALYDIDSSQDFGWNIFLQPDSSYFIIGASQGSSGFESLLFMQVSADGNSILSRHVLSVDNASIYEGNPGQIQKLSDGYIIPITIQYPTGAYGHSAAGLLRVNDTGGVVFMKTYTDTSVHFDYLYTHAIMPDGGFLGGGGQGLNIPSNVLALLIRTDSIGDTLWTRTYQKYSDQEAVIQTVAPLSGGRILVGAYSIVWVYDKYGNVNMNQPWFLILDSMGNILKDTLYGYPPYGGGGGIYTDRNGGYFHHGAIIDSLNPDEPFEYYNYSDYVAHLDTNFNMQWFTLLSYGKYLTYSFVENVLQLKDGDILAVGESLPWYSSGALGWAAKFDRNTGDMLWQHLYWSDSTYNAYFRGVAENADGSLVFTGTNMNDTLPAWHTNEDAWLVVTDSNGCQMPECSPDTPTTVGNPTIGGAGVMVYPNPTNGNVAIKTSDPGSLVLYTMQGQLLHQYNITAPETELQLPPNLLPGVYMGIFTGSDGNRNIIRLVYQP